MAMSKEEYLKKYLDGGSEQTKRKKRRPKAKTAKTVPRMTIVDDDIDFKSLLPENLHNTLEEDVGDDDPTVAEVVDERPEEIKRLESYRKDKRWRQMGNDSDDSERKSKRHDTDSDESPPRIQRQNTGTDQSPLRRRRHDSHSDQSPPRRQRHDSKSDQSPPRRQRHDSNSDQSPPRKQWHDSNSDHSPPRKRRHASNRSQSPPRRERHDSNSDQSPLRRKRHESNSDPSPPRRKRHSSDSDPSPPRRRKQDSGSRHVPQRKKRHDSDSDKSPPKRERHSPKSDKSFSRKSFDSKSKKTAEDIKIEPKLETESKPTRRRKSRFHSDSDQSPPRNKVFHSDAAGVRHEIKDKSVDKDDEGRAKKTLSGATAGLSSARQMREEAKMMRQKEDEIFSQLDDSVLGKNAKTVFRERKKKSKEEKKQEEEAEAKKAELQKKYQSWNKGLKQNELQLEATEAAFAEMSKPLTRHHGDTDLELHLKAQDREGDPMLAFIKKKPKKDPNKKELPKYKGPQPPQNRFNIWPGYRWDGVDRSNGFEKQIIAKSAERKAVKEIAYKWSVEDM